MLEEGKVKALYMEALEVTTFRTSRLDDILYLENAIRSASRS